MKDRFESLLSTVLESCAEAVVVLDQQGGIQMAGGPAHQLLGTSAGQVLQRRFVDFVADEDRPAAIAILAACLGSEGVHSLEHRLPGSDAAGRVSWTWRRSGPAGADACLVGIGTACAAGAGDRDVFLSHMGHELRNPLASILAVAETLHDGVYGPLTEAQKGSLLTIKECAGRQINLITDMVDLSRLETRPLELVTTTCRLEDLGEGALAMVGEIARSRSIRLASEFDPQGGTMIADEKRLRQVITHLMAVGILSTPIGGEARLHLGAASRPEGLLIQVAASPPGVAVALPVAVQGGEDVAGPLLRRVREVKPTGFALMQRIVHLHGGAFVAQEIAGGGLCLSISLPLKVTAPVAATPPADKEEESAGVDGAPLILLVDDQVALLEITADYLRHRGFRVCTAADGRAALEQAEALHPDLVIMDTQMPGMDGIEAIGHLRKSSNPRISAVHVISLSGMGGPGDREHCLAAGASSYLAKPFGVKALEAVILEFVRPPLA